MFFPNRIFAAVALAALALFASNAQAQVEIRFWHSMTGALGDRVNGLADRFNQSQKAYKVVPVYKSTDIDLVAAAGAAAGTRDAPDIVQVSDLHTEDMIEAGGSGKHRKTLFKPLYKLTPDAGRKFDPRLFLPAFAGSYSDKVGHMLSLPFAGWTPVFYYNKEAFKKAGLDPAVAPKTWPEVQAAAQAIIDGRVTPCRYTTGTQSWVHVENLHAWDNEEFATKLNGYDGLGTELVFNDRLEVRHISLLSAWLKGKLFTRSKSTQEAEEKFASGECAMLTSSSAAYPAIKKNASFDFAVSALPYYEDYKGAPQNTIVDGDSLWAMAGRKPASYKGIAQFYEFLLQPEVQAEWHQQTGYLPLTQAGYELSRKQGYYETNPGAETAVLETSTNKPSPISKGIHLGDYAQIRKIITEELDNVWKGEKEPLRALNDAVERGNELLRKFEKANK